VTDLGAEAEAGEVAAPETPDLPAAADAEPTQAPDPPEPAAPTPVGAVFRVMDVDDVSLELPSTYPSVTLGEADLSGRMIVFPVGLPEGTAMAQALRRMPSPRPMTHELFMQVLQRARIDVIAVRLTGRIDGNYIAELDLMTPHGRERIDCRPSDGIILALRMPVPAPILADERLLDDLHDVEPFVDD
jgi:bifunctional DNase/RNase